MEVTKKEAISCDDSSKFCSSSDGTGIHLRTPPNSGTFANFLRKLFIVPSYLFILRTQIPNFRKISPSRRNKALSSVWSWQRFPPQQPRNSQLILRKQGNLSHAVKWEMCLSFFVCCEEAGDAEVGGVPAPWDCSGGIIQKWKMGALKTHRILTERQIPTSLPVQFTDECFFSLWSLKSLCRLRAALLLSLASVGIQEASTVTTLK